MAGDPYGFDFVYQSSKRSTAPPPWYFDNKDPERDSRLELGGDVNGIDAAGSGYWECDDNSKVRLNGFTPKAVGNADSCKLNFADAEDKEYAFDKTDWNDIEMTILVNLNSFSPSDGRVILKGPTGAHHSDTVCCSGACYGVRFFCNGDLEVEFFKEQWHVNYFSKDSKSTKYTELADGNDHILKFMNWGIEKNGIKGRHLEAWIDFDADGKNFTKLAETDDLGGWGADGGRCSGDDDQILNWGNVKGMFRWDASSTDIKFNSLSVREIDPNATPDTDPEPPPPTGGGGSGNPAPTTPQKLVIPLILTFDVNALRVNDCAPSTVAGGKVPQSEASYKISNASVTDKQLSDNSTFDKRTRIAVRPVDNSSPVCNIMPFSVKFWLKKVGTPATNNVVAKIWSSTNEVLYTCSTVVTDASLSTSYGWITYDFSDNEHIMKAAELIGIEYKGTSSSNYVVASYIADIPSNRTQLSQYENSNWQIKTRELVCEIYE